MDKIEDDLRAKGMTISKPSELSAPSAEDSKLTKTAHLDSRKKKMDSANTKIQPEVTKPLFTKAVQTKETETSKWTTKEKTIVSVDLDELLNDSVGKQGSTKNSGKSLFKKRAGKVTKS